MSIFSIPDHINDVKQGDVDYSTFLMLTYPANMQGELERAQRVRL